MIWNKNNYAGESFCFLLLQHIYGSLSTDALICYLYCANKR